MVRKFFFYLYYCYPLLEKLIFKSPVGFVLNSCIIEWSVLCVLIIYMCNRQLKVMLTNVLWTDLGRKFTKTLPRNDAKLCDENKVHSDSLPSTSVDSLETFQKLEPLHQSLNLSERYVQY